MILKNLETSVSFILARSYYRQAINSAWSISAITSDLEFVNAFKGGLWSVTDDEGSKSFTGRIFRSAALGDATQIEMLGPFEPANFIAATQILNCNLATALNYARHRSDLSYQITGANLTRKIPAFYWHGGTLSEFLTTCCQYFGCYYVTESNSLIRFFSGSVNNRSAEETGSNFERAALRTDPITNRELFTTEGFEISISDTVNGKRIKELNIRTQARDLIEVVFDPTN